MNEKGKSRLNVSGVLRILGVSRSGYTSFKKRLPSDRIKRKENLKVKIKEIYDESHQNYGSPKITEVLQQKGETIAVKTVGKYMRELGIKAQYIRPYTVTTIDSDFSKKLINILNEEFNPEEPNAVWCSDSTYIWTYEGFVYLTSIMDLYSRKIISWELSTTLEAKWVIEAINKAKATKNITRPLIMYSDRGIQYTCSSYQHAYRLVFNYIDAFYNTVRIHSHCGYLSPNQYEANYETELVDLYKNVS